MDEDLKELMDQRGLDQEGAEHVRELMDEYGVDEDETIEVAEEL